MASRSRSRKASTVAEAPPALDVSIPVAHPGEGFRIAETFVARNETSILDLVVPEELDVGAWCCYARPAKGKSKDWTVVANHPDENGRLAVPVPRTDFYVWGFGEALRDAEDGESIYRLHGHNIAYSGVGRDVCWRVILRLEPTRLPVPAGVRKRGPKQVQGATVRPARKSVRVPATVSVR